MLKNWLKATIILYGLWLILSGHFEVKYMILGLIASMTIAFCCLPGLTVCNTKTGKTYGILEINVLKFTRYWLWLLLEIIKASFSVAAAVISPKMQINPHVITFDWTYENPVAVTMLVNSIILTPGTVTVDVKDDVRFIVHVLTDNAAEGILSGNMQRQIGKVFDETVVPDAFLQIETGGEE